MDLLPEKHETLILQPGHVKPLPKNATKKQKRRAGGFLEKMASMRAAKMRKAEEYRMSAASEADMTTNSAEDDSVSVASALTTSGLDAMLSWLAEQGTEGLDKVNFKESESGELICEANKAIKVGEVVLEIPMNCVVSPRSVEDCELGTLCRHKGTPVSMTLKILMYMMKVYRNHDDAMHIFMKSLDGLRGPSFDGSVEFSADSAMSNDIEAGVEKNMAQVGQLKQMYADLEGKLKADSSMQSSDELLREVFTRPAMSWAVGHLMTKGIPVEQKCFAASAAAAAAAGVAPSSSSQAVKEEGDGESHKHVKVDGRKDQSESESEEVSNVPVPVLVPALSLLRKSDEPPPSSCSSWFKLEFTKDSVRVICNVARKKGEELYGDGGLHSLD